MTRPIRAACCVSAVIAMLGVAGHRGASADDPGPKQSYGKANKQKIDAYIMLIRLRWDLYARWKDTGTWPDDKEANQALAAHGKYWEEQLKQGRALMAGGMKGDFWDNHAVIIFEAESPEQADEFAKNDPAVKAYVFQAQVRPFDVHFVTNKFSVKP